LEAIGGAREQIRDHLLLKITPVEINLIKITPKTSLQVDGRTGARDGKGSARVGTGARARPSRAKLGLALATVPNAECLDAYWFIGTAWLEIAQLISFFDRSRSRNRLGSLRRTEFVDLAATRAGCNFGILVGHLVEEGGKRLTTVLT
jgi:hypothetical protein